MHNPQRVDDPGVTRPAPAAMLGHAAARRVAAAARPSSRSSVRSRVTIGTLRQLGSRSNSCHIHRSDGHGGRGSFVMAAGAHSGPWRGSGPWQTSRSISYHSHRRHANSNGNGSGKDFFSTYSTSTIGATIGTLPVHGHGATRPPHSSHSSHSRVRTLSSQAKPPPSDDKSGAPSSDDKSDGIGRSSPSSPPSPPPSSESPSSSLSLRDRIDPYTRLARMDKPIGTTLLLWPCAWSISLAAPLGESGLGVGRVGGGGGGR